MIIVNTTFHVPLRLKNRLVEWLRSEYAPSALRGGHTQPRTARVIGGAPDDEGCSVAFETRAETLADARRWYDGEGHDLRAGLIHELGSDRVAFFTTYLQVLD